MASMNSETIRRISPARRSSAALVKWRFRIERHWVCSGGSVSIGNSLGPPEAECVVTPYAEENVAQFWDTSKSVSAPVTKQQPFESSQATGDCARATCRDSWKLSANSLVLTARWGHCWPAAPTSLIRLSVIYSYHPLSRWRARN